MIFIRKLFAPPEARKAVEILDELDRRFGCQAFREVRHHVEGLLFSNIDLFVRDVRRGMPPRKWVLATIGNYAGDIIETGNYHFMRGMINPVGPGDDFVRIFDSVIDESVALGYTDDAYAKRQKNALRDNIRNVG